MVMDGGGMVRPAPMLVIHGGAGVGPRERMSREREASIRHALAAVLAAGEAQLAAGTSALDVVERAVMALEDDPLFNAGRGGAMTSEGRVEHDAAIMAGEDRRAGAVGGTRHIRNPVRAARAVMERTPHVLLTGEGAEAVAKAAGLALVPESYFHTPARLAALQRIQAAANRPEDETVTEQDRHGTVGAVALDRQGHVAAATSTGGRTNKLPGRVGDSPVIGAGTFADDRTAAISCTGAGEYFQRLVLAHRLAMRMELTGADLRAAARITIADLTIFGGSGGFIAIDATGAVATPFNGAGMHRGLVRCGETAAVAIFADDPFPADIVQSVPGAGRG